MLPSDPDPDPGPGPELDGAAGLYIHVPFCPSVCPYCDYAVTIAGEPRREEWIEAVALEAARFADMGLRFDTVYLGGGTPSILSEGQLARVLDSVRGSLRVTASARLHLEANPEHVSPKAVSSWRRLGVGFLSVGVQSFNDDMLGVLGRDHSAKTARRAVETAAGAGFGTVSIDLIYGVAGRTRESWVADLETAVSLGADHLSCYQLTFHDGTVFGRRLRAGSMGELDAEDQAELFFATHDTLAGAGYSPYEVSNFAAAPEHRSRHNQKYWDGSSYLGLGPSAHSFDGCRRWWNQRKLRQWRCALVAGRSAVEGEEVLGTEQRVLESLILGMRTTAGVNLLALEKRFGIDLIASNFETLRRLEASGHLEWDGTTARPTVAGLAIADTLAGSIELGPGSRPAGWS